jgi:hypothetical protein
VPVQQAGHWHCPDSLADAVTVTVTESGSDSNGCPYCTGKSLAVPATVSHGPMSTVTRAFRVRVTGKASSSSLKFKLDSRLCESTNSVQLEVETRRRRRRSRFNSVTVTRPIQATVTSYRGTQSRPRPHWHSESVPWHWQSGPGDRD